MQIHYQIIVYLIICTSISNSSAMWKRTISHSGSKSKMAQFSPRALAYTSGVKRSLWEISSGDTQRYHLSDLAKTKNIIFALKRKFSTESDKFSKDNQRGSETNPASKGLTVGEWERFIDMVELGYILSPQWKHDLKDILSVLRKWKGGDSVSIKPDSVSVWVNRPYRSLHGGEDRYLISLKDGRIMCRQGYVYK